MKDYLKLRQPSLCRVAVVAFPLDLYCDGVTKHMKSQSNWHADHLLSENDSQPPAAMQCFCPIRGTCILSVHRSKYNHHLSVNFYFFPERRASVCTDWVIQPNNNNCRIKWKNETRMLRNPAPHLLSQKCPQKMSAMSTSQKAGNAAFMRTPGFLPGVQVSLPLLK